MDITCANNVPSSHVHQGCTNLCTQGPNNEHLKSLNNRCDVKSWSVLIFINNIWMLVFCEWLTRSVAGFYTWPYFTWSHYVEMFRHVWNDSGALSVSGKSIRIWQHIGFILIKRPTKAVEHNYITADAFQEHQSPLHTCTALEKSRDTHNTQKKDIFYFSANLKASQFMHCSCWDY